MGFYLAEILMGLESPDSGNFTFRNGIRVGYLGQKNLLNNDLEVLDVLFDQNNPSAAAVKNYERCLLNPENTDKLQEAISSFEEIYQLENDAYISPICIQELHEFLNIEEKDNQTDIYELRKVYA